MKRLLKVTEEDRHRFCYIGKLDEYLQIKTDIAMIKDHIKKLNQARAEFQDDLIQLKIEWEEKEKALRDREKELEQKEHSLKVKEEKLLQLEHNYTQIISKLKNESYENQIR